MKNASHLAATRTQRVLAALTLMFALAGMSAQGKADPIRVGAVFSTTQQASRSFLRFTNTGASAGTVAVTLRDGASGQTLGQWTSPSIPAGSEQQYGIATLENETGIAVKPSYYTMTVQANITGTFQHVLWREADGTLTNLSTCSAGITTDPALLSAVHSSLLAVGYASAVVITNTGTTAAAPTLGIYDARDGAKVGVATFAAIAAGAQLNLSVQAIEAAAVMTPTGGLLHYVIRLESGYAGYLQHLLTNVKGGVTTDMTTACALDGVSGAVAQSNLRGTAVFSTAQSSSQSFLRFFNTGAAAGTVTVTLNDETTGRALGQWVSPSIAANAEQQFAIGAIEAGTGQTFPKPNYYGLRVQSNFSGYYQHVLWRAADGTLTNLSTCAAGVTASATALSGVHSSLFGESYPSTVVVNNTAAAAAVVVLGIYDARDGTKLGTYTTPVIAAGGQAMITMAMIQNSVGAPAAGQYHYVIMAERPFTGFLQHLVYNNKAGVITDMTTGCAIKPASGTTPLIFTSENAGLDSPCQPGQTAFDGFLLICSDAGRFRYALAEDMPARPAGGYTARPEWYPPLRTVFRASNPPSCPASGRITLTTMLVPVDQLAPVTPQGLMAGDHVTPIDHAYISLKSMDKPQASRTESDYVAVTAPADGEIIEVSNLGAPWTNRVVIAHGCETYSVLMVMNRVSGVLASYAAELTATGRVSTKIMVRAGDKIGEQRDNPLDYSLHDGAAWLSGYVQPFSYTAGEAWKPYTVDPLPYFTPALARALEAVMRRTDAPKWGKIDHDIAGTASGNWFLAGTVGYSGQSEALSRTATSPIQGGMVAGKNSLSWSHLSISPHWITPSAWVFSVGWWRDEKGDAVQSKIELTASKPAPSALTADSGTVVYRLRMLSGMTDTSDNTPIAGVVAIRVNADETLTVELKPGVEDTASFTSFTAAKRTYRR